MFQTVLALMEHSPTYGLASILQSGLCAFLALLPPPTGIGATQDRYLNCMLLLQLSFLLLHWPMTVSALSEVPAFRRRLLCQHHQNTVLLPFLIPHLCSVLAEWHTVASSD
jgi:hypothetical protein